MNKTGKMAIIIAAIGALVLGQAAGLIYFVQKDQKLTGKCRDFTAKLESIKPGFEKMAKEGESLKTKYERLFKENKALKKDRDNLIAQLKVYFNEKAAAEDLAGALEKSKSDLKTVLEEKKKIESENAGLKDEIKKLQVKEAALAQVNVGNGLKPFPTRLSGVASEKANKDIAIKDYKNDIASMRRAKESMESALNEMRKQYAELKKQKAEFVREKAQVNRELDRYKRNYAAALLKNKKMESEIKDLPKKFAEVASENKKLIRETARMHYNLGVFYTKNKEYERAINEYEKVVEITPDDAYAHFNLGYIYAEHLVNRKKAIENFRLYLRLAKSNDPDADWVRKYLLTWETYEGKRPMQ